MIISKTPLRVSFFGGGTDVRQFYQKHQGLIISTTIDKYIYLFVRKRTYDKKILLNYFETELVDSVDEIKHDIIRECLKYVGITEGIEISSLTDVPLRGTGLGSSSSFTVGLLNALYAFSGKSVEPEDLAEAASFIEIDILKEPIGKQDQYAAAFGGLKKYTFCPNESVSVEEITLPEEQISHLGQSLMLFHTGIERKTSSILSDQNKKVETNMPKLIALTEIAEKASENFRAFSLRELGNLLSENWEQKKHLSKKIGNPLIEKMYTLGMEAGAYGGKLLGAGGGGYLLFLIAPENRPLLSSSLQNYRQLPINIETIGSQIIYSES